MQKNKTTLFETLSWITKDKNKKPEQPFESTYIINRWLSMSNSEYCKIVNVTGNRWLKVLKEFSFNNFYHSILPKNSQRIKFLKKASKQSDNIDHKTISENMECSVRDVFFLEKALEEFNTYSK